MGRIFLVIFFIALIFTSSCAVRKYIVKSLGVSHSVALKGSKSQNQREGYLFCASETDENNIVVSQTTNEISKSLSIPSFLWLSSFINYWRMEGQETSNEYHYAPSFQSLTSVPIYLRLGKLILYN